MDKANSEVGGGSDPPSENQTKDDPVDKPLRVIEGRRNIALGQAIIELHQQGAVPDTLRFLRFPPTALIGRHQALGQEINLKFSKATLVFLDLDDDSFD